MPNLPTDSQMDPLLDIDHELERFEQEERKRLGLPADDDTHQWIEPINDSFTAGQRPHTTILMGGLTLAHDRFGRSMLKGLGYQVEDMGYPDNESLRFGKEFGNRGQCNPTYFCVGNLVKYLTTLRDDKGLSSQEIIDHYVFLTVGACGPCRLGSWVTEYRKALRDAGFDGFRVLTFQQSGNLDQATGEELGLRIDRNYFLGVFKSVLLGDLLNAMTYRLRPYEIERGTTDTAIARCHDIVAEALETKSSLLKAVYRCRKELAKIKVDRSRVKPKVAVIGEFWAMTTEGDGNYKLQRFLEEQGAEVDSQSITAWILYVLWQARYDTRARAKLRSADNAKLGLSGVDVRKRLATLWVADKLFRGVFHGLAQGIGLKGHVLPDMEEIADTAHQHYDNHLRGGEGHMEVGKVILNVLNNKSNMTLSIKPFGCMPSSSVSDGIQSLITDMYPETIFLPIETSGDGAVNVYSRIQMQLFKAKKNAAREVEVALKKTGLTMDDVKAFAKRDGQLNHSLYRSPHEAACTAADFVYDAGKRSRYRFLPASIASHLRPKRLGAMLTGGNG